jgi:integrase
VASISRTGEGTWRAQIWICGVRDSATRDTKGEVAAWAVEREAEIRAGKRGQIIPRTVRQALERYSREVSPTKRGKRWEQIRLAKLSAQLPFAGRLLDAVTAADIAGWRDKAQRGELGPIIRKRDDGTSKVTPARALMPASVRREMVLLRSVFEIARKEWGWLRVNPMDDVAVPPMGRPRERRIAAAEIRAMCDALGLPATGIAETTSQRVAVAFLLALETAMRAGELVSLTWRDIDKAGRFAKLPQTKNGDARKVPLSRAALALLERLPAGEPDDSVIGVTSASLDVLFRKARRRAVLSGFTFHDARHEAVTRIAQSGKLNVLELARMIGHRDLKSLQTYFNPSPAEIAAKLD